MTETIIYNGSNENECYRLVEKYFGREANLGFKYFCNDKSLLPEPSLTKGNLVLLTSTLSEEDVSAFKRCVLIKIQYQEDIQVLNGKLELSELLPLQKAYSSSVFVTSASRPENKLVSLDRYEYMFFRKVAALTKERTEAPDNQAWQAAGFRAILVEEKG